MARKYENIDAYIATRDPQVVPLIEELRALIHKSLPGALEGIQYGAPVFINSHGVPVIYLYGSKKHVNFGFLRSAELTDPNGVLRGSGTPSKHIRVKPGTPVNEEMLAEFVRQCDSIVS